MQYDYINLARVDTIYATILRFALLKFNGDAVTTYKVEDMKICKLLPKKSIQSTVDTPTMIELIHAAIIPTRAVQ